MLKTETHINLCRSYLFMFATPLQNTLSIFFQFRALAAVRTLFWSKSRPESA